MYVGYSLLAGRGILKFRDKIAWRSLHLLSPKPRLNSGACRRPRGAVGGGPWRDSGVRGLGVEWLGILECEGSGIIVRLK